MRIEDDLRERMSWDRTVALGWKLVGGALLVAVVLVMIAEAI